MEQKKITKGEMERRIRNALVFVPKDKDYDVVYFDDKGVKLEVTSDYVVISTGYHRHIFSALTAQGVSRPYIYTKRFIEIANSNDCLVKDESGETTRSYVKLMAILKEKEDKKEFHFAWYYDLWLNNIFHPLYGIGESAAESFLVYESYLHNIARNKIILSEKLEDITNKAFVEKVGDELKEYTKEIEEYVIFPKKTDDELKQEEMDALSEVAVEKSIKEIQGDEQ